MAPNLVDYLLYEPEDSGILWIKFNRPERMNALIGNSEVNGTVAKVGEYMRAGDDDPNIRVIVLTGVGRGFCSGADMKRDTPAEMKGEDFVGNRNIPEGGDHARQHFIHGFTKLHRDISQIRKPTIAMINGPAVGAGMDMALHCDIRIGCENTEIQFLAAKYGRANSTWSLPLVVGMPKAKELLYTGRPIRSEEAERIGLLNQVVPSEELLAVSIAMAKQISENDPRMVQGIKQLLDNGVGSGYRDRFDAEHNARKGKMKANSPREGFKAFLERKGIH